MSHDSGVTRSRLVLEVIGVFAVFMVARLLMAQVAVWGAGAFGVPVSVEDPEQFENLNFVIFLSLPVASLILLAFIRYLWRYRQLSWSDFGLARPEKWGQAWLQGLGLTVLTFAFALGVGYVLEQQGYTQDLDLFGFIKGNVFAFVYMATIVAWFVAAFTEEVVFRGFVMGNLAKVFGNGNAAWFLAVILQGVIFGSLHLYQDVAGGIVAGSIGIFYGFAYWRLKNLWPVIIAHGLVDTVGMTIFYMGPENLF